MNIRELFELISDGESERLEFKRSTGQRTEAVKTVCAMLNGLGGFVLFGVSDSGEVLGQQVGAKTLEDITFEIRRIEPPAFPDMETINLKKGMAVVLLTVPDGVSIDDLDAEEIRITLDNAIRLGRLEPTGRRDLEAILCGLELIRDGLLLNGAVALYGKSDRLKTFYPQMSIRDLCGTMPK